MHDVAAHPASPHAQRNSPLVVVPGGLYETVFSINPPGRHRARLRATTLNGERAPKVVLCDSSDAVTGTKVLVKVRRITNPESVRRRGSILVDYLGPARDADEFVWVDPEVARRLEALLDSPVPIGVMLEGPQGAGKTSLARFVAARRGWRFCKVDCSSKSEPSDFFVTWEFAAAGGADGAIRPVARPTELLTMLDEARRAPQHRFLCFLDEWSRVSHARVRNAVMPLLEPRGQFTHPIENRVVDVPRNCRFIAAANPHTAEFGGLAESDDRAQRDRWAVLRVSYPPPAQERLILARRWPRLSPAKIDLIVELANAVRTSPAMTGGLSVRATLEACSLLDHVNFSQVTDRRELTQIIAQTFAFKWPGDLADQSSEASAVFRLLTEPSPASKPRRSRS